MGVTRTPTPTHGVTPTPTHGVTPTLTPKICKWCATRGECANCGGTWQDSNGYCTNVNNTYAGQRGCCDNCATTCGNPGYPTFNICEGGTTSTKASWVASNCSNYWICWCPNYVITNGGWKDQCCNPDWGGHKIEGLSSSNGSVNYLMTNLTQGQKYTVFVGGYTGTTGNPDARSGDFTQTCPTATPTPILSPTKSPISSPTPTTVNLHKRGDANSDGNVDDKDFDDSACFSSSPNPPCWLKAYGKTGTRLKADFNDDGKVDLKDFEIWRNNALDNI
ncbi:MAG: hypothetical protein QHH09_02550 [Microgenomates group bacterium]|nr:hypothetical protein [Microgenomates group bacterium]